MATLMQASHQWATRPDDERFTSLVELNNFMNAQRIASRPRIVSSRQLTVQPVDEKDHKALCAVGPDGNAVNFTHYSFGQLAARAGAPAGYLRELPAPIAADCMNYGLQYSRNIENLGVLLYKNGGGPELRAVTGPNYGRVWNSSVTQQLVDRFGDGITGQWRVPGEFRKQVEITKQNTTLYGSDRDMWVFLADEENRIEIPNRREGKKGSLARGFFVWNSEVGAATLGVSTFLFDYVCCNRIVWGAEEYQEFKIRHTASAPDRFFQEIRPAIQEYANSSGKGIVKAVEDARKKRIDDIDEFLKKRFTTAQVNGIKAAHQTDEQKPIENLWDATVGITAYARGLQWQDERVKLEREAGKILKLAA